METSIRKAIILSMTTPKTPLFKDLSDEDLLNEYRGYRALAYNNAAIASSGPSSCANQMGRIMKNIQIIEAIARKRGLFYLLTAE